MSEQAAARMVQQWEYQVLKFSPMGKLFRGGNIDETWLEAELNELGRYGWQVVGTIASSIGHGATNEVAILLQRPGALVDEESLKPPPLLPPAERPAVPDKSCPFCSGIIPGDARRCVHCMQPLGR